MMPRRFIGLSALRVGQCFQRLATKVAKHGRGVEHWGAKVYGLHRTVPEPPPFDNTCKSCIKRRDDIVEELLSEPQPG